MKQSSLDLNLSTKKTSKQELLAQMDRVVPWAALVELIAPCYPGGQERPSSLCPGTNTQIQNESSRRYLFAAIEGQRLVGCLLN